MMGRIVKKNRKKIQDKMINRKKLGETTNIKLNSIIQKQDQQDDILEVLAYEKRLHQQQQDQNAIVLLKFPDIELNKTIVKGYSPEIESVEFEMPCTKRYCLVKLKKTTNVDKFCNEITEIPFSMSNNNNRITVERCKSENQTNLYATSIEDNIDIDPRALQISNLSKTVSICNLKIHFPNSYRITIEYDDQNDSCYGLIYFRTVKEAIEMFQMSSNLTIDSHKLDVKFKRRKIQIDNHNRCLTSSSSSSSSSLEKNQRNQNNVTSSSCIPIKAVRNEKDQIEENNGNSSSNCIDIKCEEDTKENVSQESMMQNVRKSICDTGSNSVDELVDQIELKEEEIVIDYEETSNDGELCTSTDSSATTTTTTAATTPVIQIKNPIKTELVKELPKQTEVIDKNSNNTVLCSDKTEIQIQNPIKTEVNKELPKETAVIDKYRNSKVLNNDKNDGNNEQEIEIKDEITSTINWDEYRQNELSTNDTKPDIIQAISISSLSDTDNSNSSSVTSTTITTTRNKATKRSTSFILNSEIRASSSMLTINNEKSNNKINQNLNNRLQTSSSSVAKKKSLYRDGLDDLFERMNQEDDDAIF